MIWVGMRCLWSWGWPLTHFSHPYSSLSDHSEKKVTQWTHTHHTQRHGVDVRRLERKVTYTRMLLEKDSDSAVQQWCFWLFVDFPNTRTDLWSSFSPWPCSSLGRQQSHISDRPSGCWKVWLHMRHTSPSRLSLLASTPAWLKHTIKVQRKTR